MEDWKDVFVAGLGGGAIYGVVDEFLTPMLGTGALAGTAITLKDVATILLCKYGADKTSGMLQTALKGAVVIGIYKVVYPQFIEPIISRFVGRITGTTTTSTTTTETSLESYVTQKYGV
jgi:hypothetical protein